MPARLPLIFEGADGVMRTGTGTERVAVDYPIGRRRAEGIPLLLEKFETAVAGHFGLKQAARRL